MPPKKSNAGLFVGIGVFALLAASGIAYKVIGGSSKTEEPQITKPSVTTPLTHEEVRIPPPPPVDLNPAPTVTAKATETAKPVDTAPAVTAPPVTAAVTTAKPPPVVTTTTKPPPAHTTTTKPTGKPPGGGIVRDNPF
jgi:hypothetical protein